MHERGLIAALALGLTMARPALGDDRSSAALAAFEDGRKLAQAGDYTAAIARFEESERQLASVGTELNLGSCFEHERRFASAARMYSAGADHAEASSEPKRALGARKRAAALAARASSLEIQVPDEATAGLALFLDDLPVDPKLWSVPQPVDGGVHRVRVVATGHAPWSKEMTVAPEGEHLKLMVSPLDAGPVEEKPNEPERAADSVAPPPPAIAPADPTPASAPADTWTTPRITGVAAVAVGTIGIAIGAYSGLEAISQWNQRQEACLRNVCTPPGTTLGDDAKSSATVATAGFIVGAVALASGVALLVLAPRRGRTEVRVGAAPVRGGAAVGVVGIF
jgi:hypothetical protein